MSLICALKDRVLWILQVFAAVFIQDNIDYWIKIKDLNWMSAVIYIPQFTSILVVISG